jgi:biopolymer transport protein ExbD
MQGFKQRRVGRSRSSQGPEVILDVNTTPLIDVMLVLLVMLIITIPIQLHAVNLEMPVGTPPSEFVKPEKVQIDIDAQSRVYWQGVVIEADELKRRMDEVAVLPNQPEVHLRPNKDCQYRVFAQVLAASRRAGLNKLAVIGSEQFVR